MVDISIVNGVYKPTYNWGAPPCTNLPIYQQHVGDCGQFTSPDHDALGIDARIQHDTRCMSLAVGTAPRSFRVMGK